MTVNDQPLATLRIASGGLTPAQRAVTIKDRLTGLVCAGLTPAQVALVPLGREGWEIQGQGARIILVSPHDGAAQGQTARHLARSLGEDVEACGWPSRRCRWPQGQILLPFGTTRTVASRRRGSRRGHHAGRGRRQDQSSASMTRAPRRITLRGVGTGQARCWCRRTERPCR